MTDFALSTVGGRSSVSSRRRFLLASAGIAASLVASLPVSAAPSGGVLLAPQANELFRVRVEMELEGNVNVPENALVSRKSAINLPIKSEATLDYEERIRRPMNSDSGEVTAVERYYHEAVNKSLLNGTEHVGEIRDSVREVMVRREVLPEVIYSAEDYFQRNELDLLRLPVSSVAADQLLPTDRVEEGSTYAPTDAAIVSVLNLSSVEESDVTAEVVSLDEKEAKIQFRGNVVGSTEGVPTELRTIGKLTFNRKLGTCTWLAIAIHEKREIGIAEPGFDIAATIKMIRQPLAQPVALSSTPRSMAITGSVPEDRLYVELASEQLQFSTLMDRRWRVMRDIPGAAMMRMIDNDRSIAQCDLRPLATMKPGSQRTLEAFQQDVKRTLGEQLTDLIEAEQFLSPAGLRVLRVVAQGSVEGVPIQWVMQHFSDDSGRRLLATFTMEGHQVANFAGADTQLAGTLRFLGSSVGQTDDSQAEEAVPASSASDESGSSSESGEVARANFGGGKDDEVQSARGLR